MPDEQTLEKSLVIIGNEDAVSGFRALGFTAYALAEPEGFKSVLDEVMHGHPAVCLVQEDIYRAQEAQINIYRNLALPVFIPFTKEKENILLDGIVKGMRLRATGKF